MIIARTRASVVAHEAATRAITAPANQDASFACYDQSLRTRRITVIINELSQGNSLSGFIKYVRDGQIRGVLRDRIDSKLGGAVARQTELRLSAVESEP